MASLKEVRNRIASVKSTQQITSAMKLVAASKLRKAQTGILQLRPFAQKQQQLLQQLSAGSDVMLPDGLSEQRNIQKILYVVLSSNRGLCGAFNANVIKQTNSISAEARSVNPAVQISLITIGRKASEYFAKGTINVLESHDDIYDNISYGRAAELADHLVQMFIDKQFDKIYIIYHQFKNAVVQYLVTEQFLPVEAENKEGVGNTQTSYIFDPSRDEILGSIVPRILRTQLYKAILDSWASEQGARMTAMSQATDNASELLKALKLSYNKARQAAITNEILEIVSGAEALKNN
ncbi:MAG: ATP synthase F1 subunit gamma [Chloroflexota bacterium]|nr:ATP synthase F1 subunit gamma [Lentimicrobium sp.]